MIAPVIKSPKLELIYMRNWFTFTSLYAENNDDKSLKLIFYANKCPLDPMCVYIFPACVHSIISTSPIADHNSKSIHSSAADFVERG